MVNGGGVFSMMNVLTIVTISSSYAGLFQTTGLLRRMCQLVADLSDNSTPFFGVLITSMFTSMVSCNQTLAIMLTNDLCENAENSSSALALDIENSAVILAPLVPWSISNISVLLCNWCTFYEPSSCKFPLFAASLDSGNFPVAPSPPSKN